MKIFDVIVIGSGSGLEIASFASQKGLKVAVVDEGPLGGTCLNRGCIPSKMLIHVADVADAIRTASKFGIKASIEDIDFVGLVDSVTKFVDEDSAKIEQGILRSENITLYKTRAKFTGVKQLQVGEEVITAEKVFIVAGGRPFVPPFKGIEQVKVLTSTEALRLNKKPEHLVVVGGGYIACELAHFFSGVGVKTTMLVRGQGLLEAEDKEISAFFTKEFSSKRTVMFGAEIEEVSKTDTGMSIRLKGVEEPLLADQLLMATGRIPNTDLLSVDVCGIELDERKNIKVNEYLETNVPGVYAFGDVVGILPFKHTANHQVAYAVQNGLLGMKEPVDYTAIPHAVFSSPQVAGVGKTEEELNKQGVSYKVGRYEYKNTGMGTALKENGFVKVLVGEEDMILGCHIVGPDASTLIHEVVVAMKTSGKVDAITRSVHVHPALSEVVQRAFYNY